MGNPTCCGAHIALLYYALIQSGCSGAEQGGVLQGLQRGGSSSYSGTELDVAGSPQGEGKHSMKTLQLLLEWHAQLLAKRTFRSAGSVFLAYFTSPSGMELSSLGRQPRVSCLHS